MTQSRITIDRELEGTNGESLRRFCSSDTFNSTVLQRAPTVTLFLFSLASGAETEKCKLL